MRWSAADVRGTAASIAPWWSLLTSDLPADLTPAVPPPELEPFLPAGQSATPGAVTVPVAQLEAALQALSQTARTLAAGGFAMPHGTGRVDALFVGEGGVPKRPVASADIYIDGLAGDRQRTRKHHGRVWQAVCLWSAEVIEDLRQEGHPVFGGACGENVLVSGIDWRAVRPGARLRIGSALVEVSLPTIPCKQIRPFFAGASIKRVDHDRHPGSSRWYGSVLEPGHASTGDPVVVEPVPGG